MSIFTLFFYFKQNIKNQLIKNKNLFISPASSLTFQKKLKKLLDIIILNLTLSIGLVEL